ncbi:sugar transferase [Halobacillus salinarum]|uniref:Sugar transferase n=1 Tax=Halobacillus salinarum TaxID=2932257 RepID=A0ABY4ELS2_9BACI|nr:sugar transferase [Halobacillus salinarum]UOQ45397.1 sugar transferase [Halobacillus salinarum]
MKRVIDFIVSLFLIIIFTPIVIIFVIWIKIDSKGPVLFRQKRVGQYGNYFTIYKFRTMRVDTPNLASDLIDHRKYITKSGNILRKTSLDEIPQLLNIINGEMSLVGPRPALYNQYNLIDKRKKAGIEELRPGLTGLAQINGRDNLQDKDKVYWDEKYKNNSSLFLDIKILINTFITVFNTQNIRG